MKDLSKPLYKSGKDNSNSPIAIKCRDCPKYLTISQWQGGCIRCPECSYFHAIGIHSIEQYNSWLRKHQNKL